MGILLGIDVGLTVGNTAPGVIVGVELYEQQRAVAGPAAGHVLTGNEIDGTAAGHDGEQYPVIPAGEVKAPHAVKGDVGTDVGFKDGGNVGTNDETLKGWMVGLLGNNDGIAVGVADG